MSPKFVTLPSPTDSTVAQNNAKVEAVTLADNVLTIKVDVEKLTESASSVVEQGTHKWLGLEVKTGMQDITKVLYNGKALTSADVTDATLTGCSSGSFVLYIKSDVVAKEAKKITLTSEGYSPVAITIQIVK